MQYGVIDTSRITLFNAYLVLKVYICRVANRTIDISQSPDHGA
jgi:hypothetical protein